MNLIRLGLLGVLSLPLGLAAQTPALSEPSNAACEARENDTAAKLLECIRSGELRRHLAAFQAISDANPGPDGHGDRDTGTNGYKASLDYVAALMIKAGYSVTIQPYDYEGSHLVGAPSFATARGAYGFGQEWHVARLSGSGDVTAAVRPLRGAGAETASGCTLADYAGFEPGAIALIELGRCDLDIVVANAKAARAAAVVVYNRASDAPVVTKKRRDGGAFEGALSTLADMPVLAVVANAIGVELGRRFDAGEAPVAHIAVQTAHAPKIDYNLIADAPFGDPDHVVVVDAHLDSIYGAGILDNASGSATILEIALKLAHTHSVNQMRYIWFGGEEINLLGSKYYTRALAPNELGKIVFDLDADVTATPNYDILVADPTYAPNAAKFPANVVRQSAVGNAALLDYFANLGIPAQSARFGNQGTDSNSFALAGVPNSGILTQQDCCKAKWEVAIWGGYRGNYEGDIPSFNGGCVDNPHRWCDNLANNINMTIMETVSKGFAAATLTLAQDATLGR